MKIRATLDLLYHEKYSLLERLSELKKQKDFPVCKSCDSSTEMKKHMLEMSLTEAQIKKTDRYIDCILEIASDVQKS